jgi:hypothetical protein
VRSPALAGPRSGPAGSMMTSVGWAGRHSRPGWRSACTVILLALILAAPRGESRPIQAPNSHVVLDLPDGFAPASSFSGFQHDGLGISYVIQELPPEVYDELIAGFTPETLATRGVMDAEIGTLARPGRHIYIRGRQAQGGAAFEKLIVVIKADAATVLISANVPRKALDTKAVSIADVEAVLAGASISANPNDRALYRLTELGPFKQAGRFLGTATLYTLDGVLAPKAKGEARSAFIVAPSLDRGPVGNANELAQRLVRSLAGFRDIAPGDPLAVKIAGLDGVAIDATAVNEGDGHPVRVHQVLLVRPDGGYFRLVGVARAEEAGKLMTDFKRMSESFKLLEHPDRASGVTGSVP